MRKILTATTDAEKLRLIATGFINSANQTIFVEQEDATLSANLLIKVADFLDAVPPETLAAIRAGTWKAVPVEPTETQRQIARRYFGMNPLNKDGAPMDSLWLSAYDSMLAAAPAKPEE